MSAITVNSFPSLHSLTSPRSWFLAIIVLLHLGFFWALSNGLSKQIIDTVRESVFVPVPLDVRKPPPPTPLKVDGPIEPTHTVVTIPPPTTPVFEDPDAIRGEVVESPPKQPPTGVSEVRKVAIVEPGIDPRIGLTEPVYPPAAIRLNQTGTVMLSVQVLENGRVGDVRVEQSSGYARLDEAAVREARRWKFVPGTHDGVPMTMWKQIPITFRLQN